LTKMPKNEYQIYSFNKNEKIDTLRNINFDSINTEIISKSGYKIILNTVVNNILKRFKKSKIKKLGEITISTQGLSKSRFKEVKSSEDPEALFPFLAKGNVYNFSLLVEETFNTSLKDKTSLRKYYEAGPKILIRRIVNRQDRLSVGYTEEKMVFKKDINPFIVNDKSFKTKYVLALLASKLISYIYINISTIATKDDFRQTTLAELRDIPIPKLDQTKQEDYVSIVDKILKQKQHDPSTDTSDLEAEIDRMVYNLYGLTEEEVRIVEESV